MSWYQEIILAYVLDLWIGDPKSFPHPVRWVGRAAGILEIQARRYILNPFIAGCVTTVLLLLITGVGAWVFLWGLGQAHPYLKVCANLVLPLDNRNKRKLACEGNTRTYPIFFSSE